MANDYTDNAREAMYEQIANELYPEHKDQAISEFITKKLQSYYKGHPGVMKPALSAFTEGEKIRANGHQGAAVIYFVTSIELYLKTVILKPVVYGMVHHEGFADLLMEQALGQSGFDRYGNLLNKLFQELAGVNIATIYRPLAEEPLLRECSSIQKIRNKIIHQGASATAEDAELAQLVASSVRVKIVDPMLNALGLWVVPDSQIVVYPDTRPSPQA